MGAIPANINSEIPNYKEIADHKQAKETMKNYLENLMDDAEAIVEIKEASKVQETIIEASEILDDPKFMEQKGIRSLVDKDARVGHKTKTETFFGYKIEFAMIPEERIITAVTVGNGAYVDGTEFEELYQTTKECSLKIEDAYGDKAYFRKPILDILKEDHVNAYIPVSGSAYRIDDSKYSITKTLTNGFVKKGTIQSRKRKAPRKTEIQLFIILIKKVAETVLKGKNA